MFDLRVLFSTLRVLKRGSYKPETNKTMKIN